MLASFHWLFYQRLRNCREQCGEVLSDPVLLICSFFSHLFFEWMMEIGYSCSPGSFRMCQLLLRALLLVVLEHELLLSCVPRLFCLGFVEISSRQVFGLWSTCPYSVSHTRTISQALHSPSWPVSYHLSVLSVLPSAIRYDSPSEEYPTWLLHLRSFLISAFRECLPVSFVGFAHGCCNCQRPEWSHHQVSQSLVSSHDSSLSEIWVGSQEMWLSFGAMLSLKLILLLVCQLGSFQLLML